MCFGAAGATVYFLGVFKKLNPPNYREKDPVMEAWKRAEFKSDERQRRAMSALWATVPYMALAVLASLVHRRVWPAFVVLVTTFAVAAIGMINFQDYGRPHGPDFGALTDAFILLGVPIVQWIMIWVAAVVVAVIWFWPRPSTSVPTAT
jgi:hypothetical protein